MLNSTSSKSLKKNIKNKGTGAGGANTNKTGLSYERLTELNDRINEIEKYENHIVITFDICDDKQFIKTEQFQFLKYMEKGKKINKSIPKAHGCKKPDECYIDEENKKIFIIEKKFQQCSGSACEKIQTALFKKDYYGIMCPEYEIIYIYCLSDWFKTHCKAELEYLEYKKVPVFFGNSDTYKDDIINFIIKNISPSK